MLPKGHGLQHMVVVRMDIVVVVTGDAGGRNRRECQRSFRIAPVPTKDIGGRATDGTYCVD